MFITPCFIRKNTPELRKKLEELGYKSNGYECFWEDNSRYIITTIDNQGYSYYTLCIKDSCLLENELFIDCEDNEELFLALAALRDDTDKNQWVIDEANECFGWEDSWMICDKDDMNERAVYTHYRKATVEEIIEHFKDKYG